jgi:ankyrin repeat protein
MLEKTIEAFKAAIKADDHIAVESLLYASETVRRNINEPLFDRGMPPLAAARSRAMADLLMDNNASVETVSQWWAPGFGLHGTMAPGIAHDLINRGTTVTIHAAAALGLLETVKQLVADDADLVHAPGGDGGTPLHFAADQTIAAYLIDGGADVNARDEDHNSTPLHWHIRERRDISRYLITRGAEADLFAVAALGDTALAARLIHERPAGVADRIGYNNGPFPGIGYEGKGGAMYQWTLGFNLSPHEVALKNGHREIYDLLWAHSPVKTRFLVSCTRADRPLAERIASQHPGLIASLSEEDLTLPAKFCWETNKDIDAVRLMLDLGFPVETPEPNHGHTPLHNSAYSGDAELVKLLLDHNHPADIKDPGEKATPLQWAIHGGVVARRHPEGDYPRTVDLLLKAGAPVPGNYPTGDEAIDRVLTAYKQKTDDPAANPIK